MPETSGPVRVLTESFHRHLDSHGYGFQYSVLAEVQAMASAGTSAWRLQGSELPVRVGSSDTRIDFVLRHATEPVYMICECKRANPRLADWCFARMPFVTDRSASARPLIVERWSRSAYIGFDGLDVQADALTQLPDSYSYGFELRSHTKGDPHGGGRVAIDEALVQVCRGKNGFAEAVATHPQLLLDGEVASVWVFPVVFTTARLWVHDLNLAAANLDTGDLPGPLPDLRQADWLAYQYHQSVGIQSDKTVPAGSRDVATLLESEFIRTVPIVNSAGVRPFLEWATAEFRSNRRRRR